MWIGTVLGQQEMKVRVSEGLRDAERRRQVFAPREHGVDEGARGLIGSVEAVWVAFTGRVKRDLGAIRARRASQRGHSGSAAGTHYGNA